MGIISMIVYFWYVPKGYRKQHFHSLIAILKIGILIGLFHNPWNPYYSSEPYKLRKLKDFSNRLTKRTRRETNQTPIQLEELPRSVLNL